MYHFLDLTKDEVAARRLVLDKYGYIAQLSALSLLFLVALRCWLLPSQRFPSSSKNASSALAVPSGPVASDAVELTPQSRGASRERSPRARNGDGVSGGEETVGLMEFEGEGRGSAERNRVTSDGAVQWPARKHLQHNQLQADMKKGALAAWLNRPILSGWRETRLQVFSVGLWAMWLAVLVVKETGEDYMHLTKRFAQIGASLLPFHYLLGTPSRLSPLPFLFRVPASTSYNAYHRLHGALLLVLLSLHTIFYLNFFVQKGMWGVFSSQKVIMGICMVITLGVLAVMSREKVRKSWRPAFVWTHVAGAGVLLVFLWFHVAVARWYALEAGIVYGAGIFERWVKYRNSRSKA